MITALPSRLSDVFTRKTSVAAIGVRSSLADDAWVKNCGTGGGGFKPGNTCAAGGGGAKNLDTAALIESLPMDAFGKRRGVITNHGPLETAAYRVGKVDPKAKSGSVFFGLVKEDVAPYQGLHEGESIKEYKVSLKNPVIAGHQNDLTRAWFNKPYGEMMDSFQRKYGKQGASVGTAAFDKKIMTEAVKRGFDGIVYLSPAPPAKTEIAVPTSGLKSSVSESTNGGSDSGVVKSLADAVLKNCGIASGGFQPGNTCAGGGLGGGDAGGAVAVSTGPSVGGDFPKTTVVDTSKWPQHNAAAKWGAKKIAAMEDMLAKKDYSGLIAIDSFPKSSKPNGYQKAVHEAHKKLLDQAGSNIATQIMEKDAKPATAAQQQAVAPAAAPAKPPVSDVQAGLDKMPGGIVDGTKWKQTYSGDLGPGSASYKDANGTVWDVNWHDDPAVTKSVVTASKLYALAGTGTSPHLAAIVPVNEAGDWKLGVAKLKEKHDMVHEFLGPEPQQDFLVSDFAVHAWLGNGKLGWSGFANLGVMPTGDGNAKVVVQDAAGSLAYNIHGDPKNFSEHADEWNSMRNNAQNPQAASVFGSMTPDQLQKSAQKLAHITKGDVEKIVGEHYGEGGTFLTEILMKRKDSILKQAGLVGNAEAAQVQAKQFEPSVAPSVASVSSAIAKALPKPEVPKPVNVEVPQAVSQPKSSVPMAVPAPPVFVTAANPTANAKLQAIYKAAQTGDVAAVEAIGTNAESKNTYSKKAHQYKQQVLAAMGAGGKVDTTAQQEPVATPKPKASAPAKPVVIDTLKLPDQPSFVSSNKANVAANEKASNEMFEKAKAGDLIGLQAMAASMPPSPKLKEYHAGLVASVSDQLNPPPPPRPLSGTVQEILAKAPVVKNMKKASLIGKWMVAAAVPDKSIVPDKGPLNPAQQDFAKGKANWEKLPPDQQVKVRSYTSGGYHDMNDALRDGKYPKAAQHAAEGVVAAMIPLKPGTTITRNHGLDSAGLKKLKASVGTVLQDRAILSTSVNEPNGWGGNVRWHMTISPGVKGLPAKTFSASGQSEGEVILPPNTRILVTHVGDIGGNSGYTDAYAIILPYHEDQCCPP